MSPGNRRNARRSAPHPGSTSPAAGSGPTPPPERSAFRTRLALAGIICTLIALQLTLGTGSNAIDTAETVPLSEALARLETGEFVRAEMSDRTFTVTLYGADQDEPSARATYSAAYSEALVERILASGATLDASPVPRPGTLAGILISLLPLLIIFGVLILLLRRGSGLSALGRMSKGRGAPVSAPTTRFTDVAGCDEAIDELRDVVEFLRHPERYRAAGATLPRGVLLVGPPGTGKTLLARAVAGEAGVPFFAVSGSEFVEVFVGQGASRVRDLFAKARKHEAAIVFIDEIDAVGRARGSTSQTGANIESENTLNQLLTEMDGFSRSNIIVLGATNRSDMLDRALTRAGRFDRSVQVTPPDRAGRRALLELHTSSLALDADVDLDDLARRCVGMTGADIANLANRAALEAVKDAIAADRGEADGRAAASTEASTGRAGGSTAGGDNGADADAGEAGAAAVTVRGRHFDDALATLMLGRARTSAVLTARDRTITAWHEAGHAITALLLADAPDPVAVSIVPRGPAGGVTWMSGSDNQMATRDELLARLRVAVAGRAAEIIGLDGSYTAGAHNDLKVATELAESMITQWGMGERGMVVRDRQQLLLEREGVDDEISRMLADALADADRLLRDNLTLVAGTVEALLDRENLSRADLVALAQANNAPLPGPRCDAAAATEGGAHDRTRH